MVSQIKNCGKFEVKPLPYGKEDLEPYIDTETITEHHDVLYKRYVDHLNAALENDPQFYCYSLEELILGAAFLPADIGVQVFRQAGGAFNHEFYFDCMRPAPKKERSNESAAPENPSGELGRAILAAYGSFDEFRKQFKDEAMAVFGSGWAWLCVNMAGKLEIIQTVNQVTPLTYSMHPVICIDVWEHAYFLQYLAARDKYVDAWFHVANWEQAEKNYEMIWNCYRR